MGRRRTVAVLAGALVALAASVAVLAAPGGGAERARPLAAAAEPDLDDRIIRVRGQIEAAIRWEQRALRAQRLSGRDRKEASDALGRSVDLLDDAYDSDLFRKAREVHGDTPAGSLERRFVDASTFVHRAAELDAIAEEDVLERGEQDEVSRLTRNAIKLKERALERLPLPGESGCKLEQSTTKTGASIETSGCSKPVSKVIYEFLKKTTVTGFGYSPKGKVTCKQVTETTISCQLKPPLTSRDELRVDVKPKGSLPVVTLEWKAGKHIAIESEKPVEKPTSGPAPDDAVAGARAKIQAALELEQPLLVATKRTAAFARSLERSLKLLEEARDSLRGFYESFEPDARSGFLWVYAASNQLTGAISQDRQGALWSRTRSFDWVRNEIRGAIAGKQRALALIATRSAG